jgi:hypothetical protein
LRARSMVKRVRVNMVRGGRKLEWLRGREDRCQCAQL